jgi:hypothetical protein
MSTLGGYCASVERRIREHYGIEVITRDVPDPLTGDLDGATIHIDHEVNDELRLFLLAHLFGHTVQWNVQPGAFDIGRPHTPPVDEALLPAIIEYEREAAAYGLAMLHESGVAGLDQWYSDFTACDMEYLHHYYRTGEKRNFREFWKDGTSLLEPRAAPRFTPVRRQSRSDGIVI